MEHESFELQQVKEIPPPTTVASSSVCNCTVLSCTVIHLDGASKQLLFETTWFSQHIAPVTLDNFSRP